MIPDAQDLDELFDVLPPPKQEGILTCEPPDIQALMATNLDGKLFPRITRGHAHKTGAWHRAIGLWLFTDDLQLVVQRRSLNKDTHPGKWQISVAGHVTSGMSVQETVLNEAKEELGIDLKLSDIEFVGVSARSERGHTERFGDFWDCEYKFLYICKIPRRNFDFNPFEISEYAYMEMQEVFHRFETKDPDFTPMSEKYIEIAEAAILKHVVAR